MSTPPTGYRLLMTTDTVGGVWSYALQLCAGLADARVQIALATAGAPLNPHQRRQAERLPNVTLLESRYKLEWMDDPWQDLARTDEWLLEIEKSFAPDLVHLNAYAHGHLPFRAPKLAVGHSCVCSWWQAVKGEQAPATWDRYRDVVRNGLQHVDRVLAPSQTMLTALQQHYGPLPASEVIYNGIDPSRHRMSVHREPLLLSAGRVWDEAKNLAVLQQIAGRLPWPIEVAGDDRHPQGGHVALRGVRALGHLDEAVLADRLARAAIFVHPARYEPFGLAVLRAALSGCALVLGDIPSLREIWGDAALFVDPTDDQALEQTLMRLIENPMLLHQQARQAALRARRYTLHNMLRGYQATYARLLESSPRRTPTPASTPAATPPSPSAPALARA